jgi:RimJ/RimL family protein N-acetyltransferase
MKEHNYDTANTFTKADFDAFISWVDSPEIVVTIAGPYFSYPVTHDQLYKYLDDEKSIAFNVVDVTKNKLVGHAEIINMGNGLYKLDKVIIDKSLRGQGIGEQLINEQLKYCFEVLGADIVELNVFDWNVAGIRCYEKTGFSFTPGRKMPFMVNGVEWVALNMTIDRNKWLNKKKQNV